ncbi:MBG domain-containing protein, partial [Xanthobacteraceae bacterium A53D]
YADGSLTVNRRAITVTADALSRIYGNANPSLTYTIGGLGLVAGDSLSGALATTATGLSNVGTYGITQGSLAASANYDLTYAGANLAVTPRALVVTARSQAVRYGTGVPGLTYTVGGLGLVNGDTLSGSLATSASAAPNVGRYAITQGSLAASSNYAMSVVDGTLDVTPAPLTIAIIGAGKTYDGLAWNGGAGVTYAGFVYGDTAASLGGTLSYGGTAQGAVNAGSYSLTASGLTSGNYAISYVPGTLDVARASLTVAANGTTMVYGAGVPGLTYRITDGQLFGGDTLSGSLATGATSTSGVGAYAITRGTLDGANYDISYVGADLTVIPRAITVTANGQAMIYGNATPLLTYGVGGMGLVNGDTLSGALATTATSASGVGLYAITQGTLGNANYALTYVGANLSVLARS